MDDYVANTNVVPAQLPLMKQAFQAKIGMYASCPEFRKGPELEATKGPLPAIIKTDVDSSSDEEEAWAWMGILRDDKVAHLIKKMQCAPRQGILVEASNDMHLDCQKPENVKIRTPYNAQLAAADANIDTQAPHTMLSLDPIDPVSVSDAKCKGVCTEMRRAPAVDVVQDLARVFFETLRQFKITSNSPMPVAKLEGAIEWTDKR